ncbi:sensor domain-containing diguanylate cyclase [Butyrivibrio sp. YAB3001]|uniref:sensor domain-containing diguanylate cyclase n=1 Tax=Butyrivibrio sp. YAB3001 TaxID=1520812 RepID=UPI0008F65594|nr:diguanylate cyclase [Butyrivibrio sp. YAB3001]SFB83519.1 diguanylate cyclase (GGDEF) domain-containing protein [Butyrivibrio sp. YAB3001]
MKKKLTTVKHMLKRHSLIAAMEFIVWSILFFTIIFLFFRAYYKILVKNIEYEDRIKTVEISKTFDDYLGKVELLVETAASGVEDLLASGASHDEIHAYLERQSADRSNIVSNDTDGIYGYIDGSYNDGYNWIPYEGYECTERIWYKTALEAGGETVMVEPYIDARTNVLIVTVAKLLSDGESVVAADINAGGIQRIVESSFDEDEDHAVMIIDKGGHVISHSQASEIGLDYSSETDLNRKNIYSSWQKSNGESFLINVGSKEFFVSQYEIKYGWISMVITNKAIAYEPITRLVIWGGCIFVFGILVIVLIVRKLNQKRNKADSDYDSLHALSQIYIMLHKIDLEKDTFEQIMCHDYRANEVIGDKKTAASKVLMEAMQEVIDNRSLDEITEFIDLSTLKDRMATKDTISIEFLNYEHLWYRGRFVAVDRDGSGKLLHVLWAVELIDDEKRFRDKMQYLAETDRLTGINNRGSGESKIRKLLRLNKGGMFILFDADKFKSINDTFGHEAGDCVLIAIADCMKHSFRERDIVLRLGGDEFAVYAPLVYDKESARPIIERFMKAIDDINLPEINGRKICVSLGVAFYQQDDIFTFEELYKRADSCTYESKKVQGSFVTYYGDRA